MKKFFLIKTLVLTIITLFIVGAISITEISASNHPTEESSLIMVKANDFIEEGMFYKEGLEAEAEIIKLKESLNVEPKEPKVKNKKSERVKLPGVKYRVLYSYESDNNHFTLLIKNHRGEKFWVSDTLFNLIDLGIDINEAIFMSQI